MKKRSWVTILATSAICMIALTAAEALEKKAPPDPGSAASLRSGRVSELPTKEVLGGVDKQLRGGVGTDCCTAHPTPGCEVPAIEACVCAADSFCCAVEWDTICVGEVESLGCGSCTPGGGGQNGAETCAGAVEIFDGLTAFDTSLAVTDGPAHAECLNFGDDQVNQDIWWFYNATCTGTLDVETCNGTGPGNATFDTRIAIYDGASCAVGDLLTNILVCDDDGESAGASCAGFSSFATASVVAGNTYLIRLGGFGTASGTGNVQVTCTADPVGACCGGAGPLGCTNGITQAVCEATGGTYGGDGSMCAGADCDANGADDACDVLAGGDCNANGIPDSCEGLQDCDSNGVPSECEDDCNGNGIPDDCDIVGGTSQDCQPDGIPDDCQLGGLRGAGTVLISQLPNQSNGIFSDADCDFCGGPAQVLAEQFVLSAEATVGTVRMWGGYFPGNLPVSVDIMTVIFHEDAAGMPGAVIATETNVPTTRTATGVVLFGVDEYMLELTLAAPVTLPAGTYFIEVFNDTSENTDSFFWEVGNLDAVNGIVGQAFAFEAPGVTWSFDAVTDMAFELITGSVGPTDCNLNGIPDDCDIAGGTSADCNSNAQPDECEFIDCDADGLFDECEILADPSLDMAGTADGSDCNTPDGVLDACQDCNGNGIVDCADLVPAGVPALCLPMGGTLNLCLGDGDLGTFNDISATGTALGLGDDGEAGVVLPFTNTVFTTTDITVGNNGGIGFLLGGSLGFTNGPLPASGAFGTFVQALLPYWDDLDSDSGDVYWETVGTAPARVFIVQWQDRPHFPGDPLVDGNEVTLQLQIFEDDSSGIVAQYLYADTDFQDPALNDGASATIGYQDGAGAALEWSFNTAGAVTPATVLSLKIIDVGAPFSQDCNTNAVPDECDIAAGTSADCNLNGIPDECEVDCNANGVPDDCDVVGGTSGDCDGNLVPDECDPDCNQNGFSDVCDILAGTSDDCNKDGRPDECVGQPAQLKVTDITAGLSIPDGSGQFVCHTFNVPDSATIEDVDVDVQVTHTWIGDLIINVDHNGTSVGLWNRQCGSQDNMDVIFDDAGDPNTLCSDIPNGPRVPPAETFDTPPGPGLAAFNGMDKQGDWTICVSDNAGADVGTLDSWSLHITNAGTDAVGLIDCNENGLLDECDILFGLSTDCDANGIPDECTPCVVFDFPADDFCDGMSGWMPMGDVGLTTACPAGNPSSCDNCQPDATAQWMYFSSDPINCQKSPAGGTAAGSLTKAFDLTAYTSARLDYCSIYNGERGQAPTGIDAAWVAVNGVIVDDVGYLHQNVDVWEDRVIDLTPFVGGVATVSFHFDTADSINNAFLGWAIDNIRVHAEDTDCNDNLVIDQCDVLAGTSEDFNKNWCPDECEDCNGNGILDDLDVQPGQVKFYEQQFPAGTAIPDNDAAGVSFVINVDELGPVVDLDLALVIDHTNDGDLEVTLSHMGVTATLISQIGGGANDNDGLDVNLNDEALESIATADSGGGVLTGQFRPSPDALSVFDGLPKSNDWVLTVSDLAAGNTGALMSWQLRLANAPAFSQDCNFDGVPDECDEGPDCNMDGIPDDCQLDGNDCNADGIPDDCQLAGNDCNLNGVPDECEADCNANGVPDDCDIAGGALDCNANGIPDECEMGGTGTASYSAAPGTPIPDNDPAGISDVITVPDSATIADLNVGLVVTHTWYGDLCATLTHGATTVQLIARPGADNGVDVCHSGSPFGCSGNDPDLMLDDEGVDGPAEDACGSPTVPAGSYIPFEVLGAFDGMDTSGDWTLTISDNGGGDTGALTSWSLNFETAGSADCNGNGVLDECDVAAGTSLDCNADGIPDECQLTGNDCNANGVPDECDIAGGGSADINGNGIPDECEIPAHDDCLGATEVFTGVPHNDSSTFATGTDISSCAFNDSLDVWHTWTADCSGVATISLCGSGFDTTLAVYDACGGAELACNDDNFTACGPGNNSQIDALPVTAGTTYWIRVAGWNGASGAYTVNISCTTLIGNDDCASAEPLTVPGTATGNTSAATADTAPFCGTGNGSGGGVWYSVTGTGNTMTASLCGSTYDTKIRVYCGGCATLTCVAGNDDDFGACGGLQSQVSFCSQAGAEYLILVHGFGGSVGDFILNVTDDGVPCTGAVDCGPPPTGCPAAGTGDECTDPLLGADGAQAGTTMDNTGSTGDDTTCAFNDTVDEWYCYTASCTGTATASVCNAADFDTTLAVFDACGGTQLACNDDNFGAGCTGFTSELSWAVTAGTQYYVRVAGYNTGSGNYTLTLSCALGVTAPGNADLDLDGDVDLADFAILQRCTSMKGVITAECKLADIIGDGVLDLSDSSAFIQAMEGPPATAK